ncbi:LOW QUALITY PROTEIN: histone PARylation factor 1-like [Penaeus japonicus]|uniref:LOW QUALITY PROTEIN: histone PARylation factor 1-like n=1 Tax=Penaeus japonicus TaxID=27405 RepID=UPI001C70EABE|nr:LOW QUALITY PROTEIN: histone PARylation factor 1-like [Penaeus japonicus]
MSEVEAEYQADPRTACKYGESCYQKNPQHHSRFKHPPKRKLESSESETEDLVPKGKKYKTDDEEKDSGSGDDFEVPSIDKEEHTADTSQPEEDDAESPVHELEVAPSPENVRESIEQKFLVDMPEDFFDFWDLCKELDKEKPEEAFIKAGITLVGPYDILSGKLKNLKTRKISSYVCHWRYYYDPPEFMTVIAGSEDEYHIGYYRDDCFLLPAFVGSMSSVQPGNITLIGGNIFSAVSSYLSQRMKSENPFKKITLQRLQQELEKYAKLASELRPSSVQARQKKVVSKCFHGVVRVPVHNDVGYRPIPESNASLKKIFKKVVDAKSEEEKLKHFDAVQELMTNCKINALEIMTEHLFLSFQGMGLEFGLNMFTFGGEAFHKAISHVLGVAYELLGRDAFIDILRAHLKNRRRGSNMSILEVVE